MIINHTKTHRNKGLLNRSSNFNFLTSLEILAKIARLLEKLLKMRLAVEDSIHGGVVAHLPTNIYINRTNQEVDKSIEPYIKGHVTRNINKMRKKNTTRVPLQWLHLKQDLWKVAPSADKRSTK